MFPKTVIEHFQTTFGDAPQLVVRAPGRINLIGEHTDYNAGYVLPAAIDKAIWFAAAPRTDGRFLLHALDLNDHFYTETDVVARHDSKMWVNYLLGVVSEARKDGYLVGGLNLVFGGDVPLGAGLSSSAAVESGMGYIINHFNALGQTKMDLVRLAQRAENNFVGMQCGIMDMFASMMGKAGHVVRLDCRSLEYAYFPFRAPDYTIVLCNSGVKHALVDSEYNTRRSESEQGVAILKTHYPQVQSLRDITPAMLQAHKDHLPEVVYRRCQYVVEEIERVEMACKALNDNDLAAFGALMYQTHLGLQHQYEVSCPELDFLVAQTQELPAVQGLHGAVLGARMMGGGFGGCSINIVKKDASAAFIAYMQAVYRAQYERDLECYVVNLTDGVGELG